MYRETLLEYLDEFVAELREQLERDQLRWGDTWKGRPANGQERRMFGRIRDYRDQFARAGVPVPFLKIVGEAFICWVRERELENRKQKEGIA
jgi:hypothetical protein